MSYDHLRHEFANFFRSSIFFPRLGEGHLHTHFKTQRLGVVCMKSADLRVRHLKLYKD